jgi:hypothetical protein
MVKNAVREPGSDIPAFFSRVKYELTHTAFSYDERVK